MHLPTLDQIHEAQALLYRYMPPTPQYSWPLINQRLGAEIWVKHENYTPVGSFKMRSALVYAAWMQKERPGLTGVVAATRGNFGQGVSTSASLLGMKAAIVVPHGNSTSKNRAMQAQGAELIVHGQDFQESLEYARDLARQRGYAMLESFHERIVWGTAAYALEFFQAAPALDVVYVPIGLGSSICGIVAAREALNHSTEIVGVTAADSPATALSFRERKLVLAPARSLLADGLACSTPNPDAMQIIWSSVSRIVEVGEESIAKAMQMYYEDAHTLAEGAGASSLAAAFSECEAIHGKRVGVVLTGGNVDRATYLAALSDDGYDTRQK